MALPADQVPVCEGKTPDGQTKCLFYIERSLLDMLRDDGPAWKLEDARFIEEAVSAPLTIPKKTKTDHPATAKPLLSTHGLESGGMLSSIGSGERNTKTPDILSVGKLIL